MKSQNTQSVNKMISFSNTLYGFALQQANKKGITFQEYMRYLVVKEKEEEDEEVSIVDEETEKEIARAMEDLKAGRYTDCDTIEEAIAHLKKLDTLAEHEN